MTPKYSIIIGTLNHLDDLLKPCLESIRQYTDLSTCEVIVVSNGCTDGTDDYVRSLGEPFRLLTYPEPLGYAKANNLGIAEAKGQYIVLLNNDTVLQGQPQNEWLDKLERPFKEDPKVGVSGPLMGHSDPAGHDFLIFFCVMISRELVDKLKLSEDYGVGGGEDTEYCIEAEKLGYKVADCSIEKPRPDHERKIMVGGDFPVYHKGEGTVNDNPNWQKIFDENSATLARKYNPNWWGWWKWKLSNSYERAVIDPTEDLTDFPREVMRYEFAAKNLTGKKVLEIGCSSGYGLRFLPPDIEYTGVDYDAAIVDFAQKHFGGPNRTFVHADIHEFEFLERYDTIIAFEVIEHLDDGKELAQKLKAHCDTLLISTPYREHPGLWGAHHKLHRLSEKDFPGFAHTFLSEDGRFLDKPDKFDGRNLMLMKWESGKIYPQKPVVLAFVPTKNRYEQLPLTLQSIASQTRKPDRVLIYDDGDHKDLREIPIYRHLFKAFEEAGIEWSVVFGVRKGQHYGHQLANTSGADLVWRLDDDEVAAPDVLEKLLSYFGDPQVGAVGGAVYIPGEEPRPASGKLEDIYYMANVQWAPKGEVLEVDHLYSSFVYRAGIVGYDLRLSPVAHREETLFSMALKERGYKLLVDRSVVTHHYRSETGGIREGASEFFFEADNRIFQAKMESLGIKLINLDTGYGDHLVFLHLLPELQAKYPKLVLGCCYPQVFEGIPNVTVIPVGVAQQYDGSNIYEWMDRRAWKRPILDAYREMLGL